NQGYRSSARSLEEDLSRQCDPLDSRAGEVVEKAMIQSFQSLPRQRFLQLKASSTNLMDSESGSYCSLITFWFRLASLGIVGLVFAEALVLAPGRVQGWTFYLTTWEVIFEIIVRLLVAALAGMALGTLCIALLIPLLWYFKASRARVIDW